MNNARYASDSELLSANFDGENLPESKLNLSLEGKQHLKNWSLIGAALRNELPRNVNLSFADEVMSRLEPQHKIDQADFNDAALSTRHQAKPFAFGRLFGLKKAWIAVSELAIAASAAAITVIGYQTLTADNISAGQTQSAVLGPVSGLNLASYQNAGSDTVIHLDGNAPSKNLDSDLKENQRLEVERINNYIRGYVFDTASR